MNALASRSPYSAAIEMITCQKSACRALEVLRQPGLLHGFVGELLLNGLTGVQVRKVRSALRVAREAKQKWVVSKYVARPG